MKTIKIWNDNPSDKQIAEAAEALDEGKTMVIPTDTLYALACDALNTKAIEKICRLKGINPEKTHLSIICSDISMASEYAKFDNYAFQLMKRLTPGAYTFLFRSASSLPKAFKGRKVVGIRIPDNSFDRRLAEVLGHPVMSTSIKFESDDYAMHPELIAENYADKVDVMVEGEYGTIEESTIIDCTGSEPVIVRQGKGEVDF